MIPTTDVSLLPLHNQVVAIVGYGSQGRAHALNLRDSGVDVRLGLRRGGQSWSTAESDGWTPLEVQAAVDGADVVALLTPDLVQPALFAAMRDRLKPGALLLFAHGFNVHYGYIQVPSDVDCALVAPKSPGAMVRRQFEQGNGVPCLVSVHQDVTGTALNRTLAYAHGLGGTRAGLLNTTFAEETETDLFGEQAVLCGGVVELVLAGFETLTEAGYQPEVAYFECLHELKLIVDLLHEGGLERMHTFISDTASYGAVTRGPVVVAQDTRERMRATLSAVQSGEFAREWVGEYAAGGARFSTLRAQHRAHPLEHVGQQLRARMSWLPETSGGAT